MHFMTVSKTITFLSCLAAIIAILGGQSALAQNQTQPSHTAYSVEGIFAALGQGNFADAKKIADVLTNSSTPNFSAFVNAAQYVAASDCQNGQNLAEQVVKQRPDFLPAYDLIAECMSRNGQAAKAARIFKNIASRMPEGSERDQLLARATALTPKMPYSISVSAEALPSSNLNRGTDDTKVGRYTISPQSRSTSGTQYSAEIRIDKPVFISDTMLSTLSLSLGGGYDTLSKKFWPTARFEASHRWFLSPRASLGVASYVGLSLVDQNVERVQPGFIINYSKRITSQTDLSLTADISHLSYRSSDHRDGLALKAEARLSHILTPKDKLTFSMTGSWNKRKSKSQSSLGAGADLEWEHRFEQGFITSTTLGASATFHEGFAPLTTDHQRDYSVTSGIALSHEAIMLGSIRPEIGYKYTKQWSNDPFSRYDAHDITFRAKAAF